MHIRLPYSSLCIGALLLFSFVDEIISNTFVRRFLAIAPVVDASSDSGDSLYDLNGHLLVKSAFDSLSEHFLLPQDFYMASITPVYHPSDDDLDAISNSFLFEGDIIGVAGDYNIAERRLQDATDIFSQPLHSSLNLGTYPDKLWEGGRVPYMLEEGMTEAQRAAIAQAFDEYKDKTCVRFIPREETDFDYIYIKRNVAFGCSSYVGRAGGNQTISLETGKCFTKGIIAHELMHALGFFHEHSRTDRDQYVDIVEDNIRPGMLRNFEKYPRKIIDPLGMPYDFGSVMHYHKLAFSRNGKPTIVPREDGAEIGQRYKLSIIDAQKVNKLYQCGDFATTTTTTTTTSPTTTTRRSRPSTTTTSKRGFTTRTTTTAKITTTTPTTTISSSESTTTSTTTTNIPKKCEDLNAHCDMWLQLGHCKHSAKYMAHYCRKSCDLCSSPTDIKGGGGGGSIIEVKSVIGGGSVNSKTCLDKNLFCGYWAKIGECKSESKFMKIFCKRSCDQC